LIRGERRSGYRNKSLGNNNFFILRGERRSGNRNKSLGNNNFLFLEEREEAEIVIRV